MAIGPNPYRSPTIGSSFDPAADGIEKPLVLGVASVYAETLRLFRRRFFAIALAQITAAVVLVAVSLAVIVAGEMAVLLAFDGLFDNRRMMYGAYAVVELISYSIVFVLCVWTVLGQIGFSLNIARGQRPDLAEIFRGGDRIAVFLAATVLAVLGVMLGGLLLVAPGVLLALAWRCYPWLVVDRRLGPIDALKESMRATRASITPLILLDLCHVSVLALLALLTGILGNTLGDALTIIVCAGFLFCFVPFVLLTMSVGYVRMIGEPVADPVRLDDEAA